MVDYAIRNIISSYISDYVYDFGAENFKTEILNGKISISDLILNKKILKKFPNPFKLTFGMIGHMEITVPSFIKLTSYGLKIKVSDIFICLSMKKVDKWKKESVYKKYQEMKKQSLKTLMDHSEMMFEKNKSFASSGLSFTGESLDKLIANINIEIENVYLMFEDSMLKFSIGLLLPNIKVQSLDEFWNKIELIEDPSLIAKLLTIQNVSIHVNYGDNFKSFE